MLNGLDLFSGIGGISFALKDWVRSVAYCEIDPYCQGVLISRMADESIPTAPIWDNVRTLSLGITLREQIEIIYGGFPCQDISIAGHGKGLAGERSGLFFEIVRLAEEIKPSFIFLENVPAITSRGGAQVCLEVTSLGYDCRWCVISAASVGALHRRERWFFLAHSNSKRLEGDRNRASSAGQKISQSSSLSHNAADSASLRRNQGTSEGIYSERSSIIHEESSHSGSKILNYWENTEPPVCGVAHGIPNRVDRIKALGNSVVPQQAKEAFKILMGIK